MKQVTSIWTTRIIYMTNSQKSLPGSCVNLGLYVWRILVMFFLMVIVSNSDNKDFYKNQSAYIWML